MAQLDIQQKKGAGWLWWAIGLVVLALLAWWIVAGNDRAVVVDGGRDGEADSGVVAPAVAADGQPAGAGSPMSASMITELSTLTGASTIGDLAGRPVVLTDAPVFAAVSDKGFWIGSDSDAQQRVFVVRGNQMAAYTAPDGAVNAGTRVNIYGTVQKMPADLTQQNTTWNIKSTDSQLLAKYPLFIQADSVQLVKP